VIADIPTTMTAVRYAGAGRIKLESLPTPDLADDEVLLRVAFCGVCGSDVSEYKAGPLVAHISQVPHPNSGQCGPLVLGHELAGYVVARGPDADLALGTLVACGAGISCGTCRECRRDRTNLCERYFTVGFHRDGGLAEYCAVPARICIDAAQYGVDAYVAGLAQPMAIAIHAFRRGLGGHKDGVAIVGAGGIGAFLTFAAAEAGLDVAVFDLDDARLELASCLGASQVLNPSRMDAGELAGQFDLVYEVSGSEAGIESAFTLCARGGRIVQVGVPRPGAGVDPRGITLNEITVLGTSAHAVDADLPEALRLLGSRKEGWSDVAPMAFPLRDVVGEGLDGGSVTGRIKTLFAPWSSEPMSAIEASIDADRLLGGKENE
jgi:(R,R)-butanediol dehydrogenase/meso-butanediol dehydrogenase/diacetyl reductase